MSEAVSGFTVEPAAIINMIRENLVDRYRDAYSIVKELIQNSDDAKATRMELGWCNGLGAKAIRGALEVHPRAVRSRAHRHPGGWCGAP